MKFEWCEAQDEAFKTLKEKLCSAPVLSLPNGSEGFVVYSDASKFGLGCVLMQNGKVIAYASRRLKEDERNYLYGFCLKFGDTIFTVSSVKSLRITKALNICSIKKI